MRKDFSLYKQYIYLVVIIPLLILILTILVSFITYEFVKRDRKFIYFNELTKITSVVESNFNYIEKFARVMGDKIIKRHDYTPEGVGKILKRSFLIAKIGQDISTLTNFDFVTLDGKVIANATEGALDSFPTVKKEERLWMNLAPLKPWTLIIDPKVGKGIVGKDQIVDYGIPAGLGITNEEGKPVGIISAGIDIEKLVNKIKENFNANSIRFLLFNDNFDLIAQSNANAILIDKNLLKKLIPLTPSMGILNKKIQYNGTEYFVYQRMNDYPFIILVGEDDYILSKLFRERVILPAIFSFMICLLLFILFLFFRNKLIIPIKMLSDMARFIPEGKNKVLIPEKYNSLEISNLAYQIQKISTYTNEINNIRAKLEDTKEELQKTNKSLEQNTVELKQALAAKTEFLNNMSHEIRTPMQGFTVISTSLVEHWQEFNDERKYELADKIASNAKRLSSLLSHLLDLSKFQAGKMRLSLEKIDLNLIITEMIEEAKTLYINGKQLQINFTPLKEAFILADKERIGQVLRNLFVNSIKFSPNNSTITVSLELSEITYDDQNKSEAYHFSIKDEGVGVPENELYTIFEVFVQSSKTKIKAGGTGLGLAICKEIIDAHHGEIWAENNEDKGATFNFVVPISQAKQMDGHKIIAENNVAITTKPAIQTTKSANILIIDDEEACLMSMELLLFGSGYNLHKAVGGYAGLEYLKEHSKEIDLILLDLMMPDIYGLNVLAEIKQDPALRKIPVILQTGSSDNAEIERAFTLGIFTYIKKPYQKQNVIAELAQALKVKHGA
ncbi:Sensor histidine kinase [Rickettsiales bacterium Ac37b]|nr:Sensor histidine kinase [Rickettsiales bacterium Ac37b]